MSQRHRFCFKVPIDIPGKGCRDDYNNSIMVDLRRGIVRRTIRKWEKEIPDCLKKFPNTSINLNEVKAYKSDTLEEIVFRGRLTNSQESFFGDMMSDLELIDEIKYYINVKKIDNVRPDYEVIIKEIADVGPHKVTYITRFDSFKGGPISYQFEYVGEEVKDLRRMMADVFRTNYIKWLNELNQLELYFVYFKSPSCKSDMKYRSTSLNDETATWEELANIIDDEDFDREHKVGMRLAIMVEEITKELLLDLVETGMERDGYFYQMLLGRNKDGFEIEVNGEKA